MTINEYIDKILKKDPGSDAYLLEIALENYDQVFNKMDPSPYRKRDLNTRLKEYLQECSRDIPFEYPLKLVFRFTRQERMPEMEEMCAQAIEMYLAFMKNLLNHEAGINYKRCFMYFLYSLLLILLSVFMKQNLNEAHIIYRVLAEGVTIGGWVFMWEAVSRFFISRAELNDKVRSYERFTKYKIEFEYGAGEENED